MGGRSQLRRNDKLTTRYTFKCHQTHLILFLSRISLCDCRKCLVYFTRGSPSKKKSLVKGGKCSLTLSTWPYWQVWGAKTPKLFCVHIIRIRVRRAWQTLRINQGWQTAASGPRGFLSRKGWILRLHDVVRAHVGFWDPSTSFENLNLFPKKIDALYHSNHQNLPVILQQIRVLIVSMLQYRNFIPIQHLREHILSCVQLPLEH